MALRSFFSSLRKYRSSNPQSLFTLEKPIFRSFSSSMPINNNDNDNDEEPEDSQENHNKTIDLKTRIFRLRFPKRSATTAIQKWVDEGNKVSLSELRNLAKDLRKSQRYKHALEISEWMVGHKEEFELSDSDYANRIDLITKVFGVDAAERYFEGLPPAVKTGETYTALLHCYASAKLTERAEDFFERIRAANVPMDVLAYNEMMTLYTSVGQLEKVFLVIEEIKKHNVSMDLFSYNLWISACASTMDIDGVRRILDEMSADGNSNEGWVTYRQLTNIYITAGNLVSAVDSSLFEADKKISQREWVTYDFLIILYAGFGYKERIDQIWKSLKLTSQKMTSRNYICVLSSYLMLGQLREAGGVLDEWKGSKSADFDAQTCKRLLEAFTGAGLMEKAESLRTLMIQKNCDLVDGSD